MKLTVFVDKDCDEEVIIYCKERHRLVEQIEKLMTDTEKVIVGYDRGEIIKLDIEEIYCFSITNNKLYAICESKEYLLKERLYKIEAALPSSFVKVNQSCVINIEKIQKFSVSAGGTLKVILKNGYSDFVSRRNLKAVKERIGI